MDLYRQIVESISHSIAEQRKNLIGWIWGDLDVDDH
jgi:hypothetical protein